MEKIEIESRIALLADPENRIKAFKGFGELILNDKMNDDIESFNDWLCDNANIIINFEGQESDIYIYRNRKNRKDF